MTRATIFEEHSSVLPHWFAQGVSDATLIYLDAHLDLQFIDASRIGRLRQCANADELTQLECRHPFSPQRSGCFGIEDFLYPAACLGMIRRLIWVAPPHVLQVGLASAVGALQQMESVTLADLESFHRSAGGWIEGRLLGLDLVMCDLSQLPGVPLDGPVRVDIDTDYFVAVPDDTVWAQPRTAVLALKALVGEQAELTIARSVGSGFLPLRHRFLADHLAALWESREEDAEHWQRLLDLEWQCQGGRRDHALAGLTQQLARRPDCAASCYALALATPAGPARAHYLAQSARLDSAYADKLLRRLGEFRARWKRVDRATVLALHREVADLQDRGEQRASAWTALGLLYADLARLDEALGCDRQALRTSEGHPELALEIAKLYIARGAFADALPLLNRAVADDELRIPAWRYLAECALALGSPAEAHRLALMAHRGAPAWPDIVMRLAAFAQALGEAPQAQRWLTQHEELERRISRLLTSLA